MLDLMTASQEWWPADYGHYGPKIQEYLREATQEEYRNLLEDLDLSDYSENYEDNSYV